MPQKRDEVEEEVDTSPMIPDIYENWLQKQVSARSGSMEDQDAKLGEQAEEDDNREDKLDRAGDAHEKAHRRKRGKTTFH